MIHMQYKHNEPIEFVKWDGTELCAQVAPELYYLEDMGTGRPVKDKYKEYTQNLPILRRMCFDCPRLEECRTYAIKHELYGFWGGMSERERKEYRRKNKIKLLRPELYSDYLPRLNEGTNDY